MTQQQPILATRHREHLRASAISDEVIERRGYVSIEPGSIYEWRQIAGTVHSDSLLKRILHQGALAFPLYRCGEDRPFTWVLRPDMPRTNKEGKPVKYEYPANTPNVLDLLPEYRPALGDPDVPIWITEGCKKADALATAYGERIVPINENGVWGWRSKGKLLEDFKRIVWEGRSVIIAPDGDVRHNKQVRQAIDRSARLFMAWGAREVLICLLPSPADGPKVGVDDYLAMGNTPSDLEQHLVELATVETQARVSLMKHPHTGTPLFLPAGYDVRGRALVRNDNDTARHFYSGLLAVLSTGRDITTGEETATVCWDRFGQLQEINIPRVALTSASRCSEALGAAGVSVHALNAREMSRYLVEFINENDDVLPRVDYINRMGYLGEERLMLPAGPIGLPENTRYTGTPIEVGDDPDAYPEVLRAIAGADGRNDPWTGTDLLWSVFALTLASPVIARLRPNRNPVVMLAGASTAGKSTLAHFGVGTYGNPREKPLQAQCGSPKQNTTGILQLLPQINGLPLHLEDVHVLMAKEPIKVAGLIYDYANGQLRTYGTVDQRSGGGTALGGTLLMSGEVRPEFDFEGSQRRLLLLDCTRHPPLGVPRGDEGERRAAILESAQRGYGMFGHQACELIWANWPAFLRDVAATQQDDAIRDLPAWNEILAAAVTVLRINLAGIGIELNWQQLLRSWAGMLTAAMKENNPAKSAFDKVLMMMAQCETSDNAGYDQNQQRQVAATWRWLLYDRKMVAAQRIGDDYWRVLTGSPQWLANIGPGAVDRFGDEWQANEYIVPPPSQAKGRRQVSDKFFMGYGRGTHQCILVPDRFFHAPDDHE